MARRLLAFVLAFVIVGGPLATDICEAACTEHAGHSIDSTAPPSHDHHSVEAVKQPSHHDRSDVGPAPATKHTRFTALWLGCSHLEAIVSEPRELTRVPVATAVATLARITPLPVTVLPTSQMDSRHGPSTSIRSTSPLRI
jgi:hypothetical protein